MRAPYAAGLVEHVLATTSHAQIASIARWKPPEGQAHHWPPLVLRVELRDGSALLLAVSTTSGPGGNRPGDPLVFNPADLSVASGTVSA